MQDQLASSPGFSLPRNNLRMTFDPPERKADGSKVIRRLLRGRREKPGDEAKILVQRLTLDVQRVNVASVMSNRDWSEVGRLPVYCSVGYSLNEYFFLCIAFIIVHGWNKLVATHIDL